MGYEYASVPKRRIERCNLCGHDRFVILAHTDRYGFAAPINTCLRCGLTFMNPALTEEACARFYAEVYRPLVSAYHGRLIDAETVEDEQGPYAQTLGDMLEPHLSASASRTLLDMGGSTGVVAESLARRFGLQGTVCDPSPDEATRAAGRGLETVVGTAEEYDPGERRFDLVILCQTVDHLLNVSASLANLRKLLSPTGLFFMDIVDFRAAYLRSWRIETAAKIDHSFYLTQHTAEAYLARSGFDVLQKSFAQDRLHVGYVCRGGDAEAKRLPPPETVERMLEEIRYVQNAPRPE